MEEQTLYAKESKFDFGIIEVLYLGHIIGGKGVSDFTWSVEIFS
jgi:hypothetical protein